MWNEKLVIKMDFILKHLLAIVFYSTFIKSYENKFKCAHNYTHVHIHGSILSNGILSSRTTVVEKYIYLLFYKNVSTNTVL